MLNSIGGPVNHKRRSHGLQANHCRAMAERIWRWEGLKVPQNRAKKGWIWLNFSRDITAGQWTERASGCGRSDQTTSPSRQVAPATFCRVTDALLNGEIFSTLREAQILIRTIAPPRQHGRTYSSLSYRPPAPETVVPVGQRPTMREQSTCATRLGHVIRHGPFFGSHWVTGRTRCH